MDVFSLSFSLSNLGPKTFQKLILKFGSSRKAWEGTEVEYKDLGIVLKTYETFNNFRKSFDYVQYAGQLKKENVFFVSFLDKQYPTSLKKLPNPPIGLFVKGNEKLLSRHPELVSGSKEIPDQVRNDYKNEPGMTEDEVLSVAVVGTRKITNYGKSVTEGIVSELVRSGACIVSGLALGVDGAAHKVALENNGSTIAVLGCGVDCCFPSENYGLYKNIIAKNGLIISEYPLSLRPNKGTFLARNRIVAALSKGVLITEAAVDSGSLVTADWGQRLGKKVFAVPGPINSQMVQGSLKLLKQGARLVTNGEDILKELSSATSQAKVKKKVLRDRKKKLLGNLSTEEKKIVRLLENEELSIDEISKKLSISVSKIAIHLSQLELRGVLKNNNGKISRRYE